VHRRMCGKVGTATQTGERGNILVMVKLKPGGLQSPGSNLYTVKGVVTAVILSETVEFELRKGKGILQ